MRKHGTRGKRMHLLCNVGVDRFDYLGDCADASGYNFYYIRFPLLTVGNIELDFSARSSDGRPVRAEDGRERQSFYTSQRGQILLHVSFGRIDYHRAEADYEIAADKRTGSLFEESEVIPRMARSM